MITFKLITIATILTTIVVLQACGKKHRDDEPAPALELAKEPEIKDPENDKELRLRGYVELSSIVESSILKTNGESSFSFQQLLGGEVNFFAGPIGLTPLMGYYSADPAAPGWKNVTPNTVSSAVYLLAFDELALDLAKYCDDPRDIGHTAIPNDNFKSLILTYCTNPQLPVNDMKSIWLGLTADLVPQSEFEPWLANLKQTESLPAKDRMEIMVTTAMASPWFIFKN